VSSAAQAVNGAGRVDSRTHDEQAVARLLEQLRPKLELIARQRGVEEPEDAVQETLLAAVIGLREGKFHRQSTIETWIYGILRNKIGDHHRLRARETKNLVRLAEHSSDGYLLDSSLACVDVVDPDLRIAVEEVLDSLPARHWLVLMLNCREGLKTHEIAPLIRLSPGRTGAILAEAKAIFRRRIAAAEENATRMRLIK
jgi:RNA polymerase sigma factor (sigma-70 family)